MWKLALAFVCLAGMAWSMPFDTINPNFDYESGFNNFVQKFNRVYKDDAERQMRYKVFIQNVNEMVEQQKKMPSAKFGITKFADWTKEEKHQLTGVNVPKDKLPKKPENLKYGTYPLPASFDWRQRNMVTPVKDQGQCGSCWTFQTVALVESHQLMSGKPQILLSEQELVDCDHLLQSDGCNGGWPNAGLKYVVTNGLETEKEYPYKAVNQKCSYKKPEAKTKISKWEFLGPDENNAAYQLTKLGPIGYDIWVPDSFYNYVSGVYQPTKDECQTASDSGEGHAVTIVGFGTEGGVPYWLIKNSWGADWGLEGYFKIKRGDLSCAMGYGIGDNTGDFGDGNEWFVAVTA